MLANASNAVQQALLGATPPAHRKYQSKLSRFSGAYKHKQCENGRRRRSYMAATFSTASCRGFFL